MDKKAEIILNYLHEADLYERHKYALGFNYDDDLYGIELLVNDKCTDISTALTILFNLLPMESYDPDCDMKKALIETIKENVISDFYTTGAIAFSIDADDFIIDLAEENELSKTFFAEQEGVTIPFPVDYFEGLPPHIDEEIKALKPVRKKLP